MSRRLVALVLAAVVVLGGCGDQTGPSGTSMTDRQCRRAFADLAQLNGENGNTAEAGTALADSWDAEQAATQRLAKKGTAADCPDELEAKKQRFASLIDLGFSQYEFDMLVQLRFAEHDLEHAIRMRDYDPLPKPLQKWFTVLRAQAQPAHDALSAELEGLAAVDLENAEEVEDAITALSSAAKESEEYRICQRALRVIGDYELSEE